jgi:hypothetical protein
MNLSPYEYAKREERYKRIGKRLSGILHHFVEVASDDDCSMMNSSCRD